MIVVGKKLPSVVNAVAGVAVVVGVGVAVGIGVAVVVVDIICEDVVVVVVGTVDVVVDDVSVAVLAVVSSIRAKNHNRAPKKLNTIMKTIFLISVNN